MQVIKPKLRFKPSELAIAEWQAKRKEWQWYLEEVRKNARQK